MFSINPDAHSIAELDLMRWELAMARKGAGRVRDTTTWCGSVGIVQVRQASGSSLCVSGVAPASFSSSLTNVRMRRVHGRRTWGT
jgi:hypothetical protein